LVAGGDWYWVVGRCVQNVVRRHDGKAFNVVNNGRVFNFSRRTWIVVFIDNSYSEVFCEVWVLRISEIHKKNINGLIFDNWWKALWDEQLCYLSDLVYTDGEWLRWPNDDTAEIPLVSYDLAELDYNRRAR
jgi:hypothetical protein